MNKIIFEIDNKKLFGNSDYDICIQKIGQEYCNPRKKYENRKRDYNSLHFVLYGSGVLTYGAEKAFLSKGSAFLLYANESYTYYPESANPWAYIWIDFYGNELDSLFSACGFNRAKPYIHVKEYFEIVNLFKQLLDAYDASIVQQMTCSAYFMLILSRLIGSSQKSLESDSRYSAKFKKLRDVLIYINNNYRMELTIDNLSANTNISVSRLMALFSEMIKMTPISYINRFRVSSACEMLKFSDEKIDNIAKAVGITDPKYFARVFKKWKRISPFEYRKSNSADNPFSWLKEFGVDFR